MALQDILLALRSFPTPTSEATIEQCIELAVALQSRLSALACGIVPRGSRSPLRHALIDIAATLAEQSNTSAADAERLLATFREAAAKRSVLGTTRIETCELAQVARTMVEQARFHDLTVLPVPEADYLAAHDLHWFAESLIFESGHPTLVVPLGYRAPAGQPFETVVVAWDGSRGSTRAIADAQPLLQKARQVRVMIVANRKTVAAQHKAPDLLRHLAVCGVEATLDVIMSDGRSIDQVFGDHARAHGAGLIVMGAYGQSRLREFVLGGATQHLLSNPPTPLLLSY